MLQASDARKVMNFKMKNSKEIEPLSQYTESSDTAVVPENRLAGTVGALLFSLAGGVVYFLLYQVGYIAAISGLIGVICAFKDMRFSLKSSANSAA